VNPLVVGVEVLVPFQMVKFPVTVRVTVRGVSVFGKPKCLRVEVEDQTWVIR